jgi:hypothetical protein
MLEIFAVMAVVAWACKSGSQDKKREYLEEEARREKQFKDYDPGYSEPKYWDH